MAKTSLRFYIDGGVLQCTEFKARLLMGAGCEYKITENYVQFSNDFMHLQPSSFLAAELLDYLNKKTTKVTLLVNSVSTDNMIEKLRPISNDRNLAKEFSLKIGENKISGANGVCGLFDLLCEAKISQSVFALLQAYAPGLFPEIPLPIRNFIKNLGFWNRLKFVFGFISVSGSNFKKPITKMVIEEGYQKRQGIAIRLVKDNG